MVRLSGPQALEIGTTLFQPDEDSAVLPNRVRFGAVVDPATGERLDEAILTYFKAPRSYTGEDVVEISCHGSPVVLRQVLALATQNGARIAEPGEFTFRAFFNKRIDLAQAQAVRDIINAQTDYQARVATQQLEGGLSSRLAPLKAILLDVIVHLESSIEFSEEDIATDELSRLTSKVDDVVNDLRKVAASFSFGKFLKEGFDLAIVGRPNVGKSSVFNRLVGAERAIVTELPGTTRDTLYEITSVAGVPVRLIDTAGVRETGDVVESLGITRTRAAITDADISLLILDSSEPLTNDDIRLLDIIPPERRIVVFNKTDLLGKLKPGFLEPSDQMQVIPISALTGSGFDRLRATIFTRLSGESAPERDDVMITDARQHAALIRTTEQLSAAREIMARGELEEVILLRLRGGLNALGEITGETLTDDILNQIFSTFCIGK